MAVLLWGRAHSMLTLRHTVIVLLCVFLAFNAFPSFGDQLSAQSFQQYADFFRLPGWPSRSAALQSPNSSADANAHHLRDSTMKASNCINGGTEVDGACVCPVYYTGETCTYRQCPNSIDGKGPFHVLPPNENMFCDRCNSDLFSGINCQLCKKNDACKLYAGGEGLCDQGMVIRGDNKQIQCDLNSPYFLDILGDGRRISSIATMECSGSNGAPIDDKPNSACYVNMYRVEENNSYIDSFFRCNSTGCSMKLEYAQPSNVTETITRRAFRILRPIGQISLIVLTTMLAVVGGLSKVLGRKRARIGILSLSCALIVVLLLHITLMTVSISSVALQTKVVYECTHTSCQCSEDPPAQYTPICSQSPLLVDSILPSIKNSIHFSCLLGSNKCALSMTDIALIFDVKCQATECVNGTKFPSVSPDYAKSTAEQVQTYAMIGISAAVFIFFLIILVHWKLSTDRTRRRARHFASVFHLVEPKQRAPQGGAPENTTLGMGPPAEVAHTGFSLNGTHRGGSSFAVGEEDQLAHRIRTPEALARNGDNSASVRTLCVAPVPVDDLLCVDELRAFARSELELSVTKLQYVMRGSCCAAKEDAATHVILNNINLTVRSGEVLAILGPSGAGKTTLLDLLAARVKSGSTTGSISLNGTSVLLSGKHRRRYRNIVGYVAQEDTLLPGLTVRQSIEYAARLKLPRAFSTTIIQCIVNEMLEALKLKNCEHTLVGDGNRLRGISGGEKRRVSIALELLANPRVLFLDEPTSGLDAISAKRVIEVVSKLAKNSPMRTYAPYYFSFNPIVIFSIHQPSQEIYSLFDSVVVLSRGTSIYCGPASTAAATLEQRLGQYVGHISPVPSEAHRNDAEYVMKLEEVLDDNTRIALQEEDLRCAMEYDYVPHLLSRLPGVLGGASHGNGNRREAAVSNPALALEEVGTPHRRTSELPADQERGDNLDHSACGTQLPPPTAQYDDMMEGDAILQATEGLRVYYANTYQQLYLLTSRSVTCMMSSCHLVVCHAAVVACMASLMWLLYNEQALDLPGVWNRSGSISFFLLVTSFVSLSSLEQLVVERKQFVLERENGFYTTLPYLVSKIFVDVIPLRVIPSMILTSIIYFPLGLRTDSGWHLFWFITVMVLFSVCTTMMVLCVGIITGTFGPAALISSVLILWNFVFGGAMVQAETIPKALIPFRIISPVFLAFEALLVNELNGQDCIFSPTDETGKPSDAKIPIQCVQYLANIGLKPSRFYIDMMQLAIYCVVLTLAAWLLLTFFAKLVR